MIFFIKLNKLHQVVDIVHNMLAVWKKSKLLIKNGLLMLNKYAKSTGL